MRQSTVEEENRKNEVENERNPSLRLWEPLNSVSWSRSVEADLEGKRTRMQVETGGYERVKVEGGEEVEVRGCSKRREEFERISLKPTRSSSRKNAGLTVKVGNERRRRTIEEYDFVGGDRGVNRRVLRVVSIGVKWEDRRERGEDPEERRPSKHRV